MVDGTRTVDCVFTMLSPWAYVGHRAFIDLCRRRGVTPRYRPVPLSSMFPESGGLPLKQRHPSRQAYRLVELRRWRDRRGLGFDLEPPHWPFDPALADRAVGALARAALDPGPFVAAGFSAVWEQGRDLGDPAELSRLLAEAGHDGEAVLSDARSPAAGEAYAAEARRALAEGVFGAPTYIFRGEVFWGQDRLDLLDDALASGRVAYGRGEAVGGRP